MGHDKNDDEDIAKLFWLKNEFKQIKEMKKSIDKK